MLLPYIHHREKKEGGREEGGIEGGIKGGREEGVREQARTWSSTIRFCFYTLEEIITWSSNCIKISLEENEVMSILIECLLGFTLLVWN